MKNGKSLGLSIFGVMFSIILIALIVLGVTVNYVFGTELTSGDLFGMKVFIMNSDIMEPEISEGSAVFAESGEISVLTEGNVILFKDTNDTENIMRISQVVHNTDSTVYKMVGDNAPDRVLDIPKENVVAKCSVESAKLGSLVRFMRSMPGVIICMLIPGILLIALIVAKVLLMRKREREDDDEIVYPATYGIGIGSGNSEERDPSKNPLFDPSKVGKSDESFAMKKSSIAENFSVKNGAKMSFTGGKEPVERDPQEESAVERFRAAVDEKPNGLIGRRASLAPDIKAIDKSDKLAAIKAVLSGDDEVEENETVQSDELEDSRDNYMTDNSSMGTTDNTYDTEADSSDEADYSGDFSSASDTYDEAEPEPANREDNIRSIDDLIKALEEEKRKL